ncbi:MAG: hypothetical protein Ct9H300mP15_19340 [Gemmatimonadota bacterium]|nr:MAG: hypothetical protein Ct9H300mP15_19340 [Gemmatimonadota bacterium]
MEYSTLDPDRVGRMIDGLDPVDAVLLEWLELFGDAADGLVRRGQEQYQLLRVETLL